MYAEIEMGSGVRCDAQSIASTNTEKLQERKAAQGVQRTWGCFAARVEDSRQQGADDRVSALTGQVRLSMRDPSASTSFHRRPAGLCL